MAQGHPKNSVQVLHAAVPSNPIPNHNTPNAPPHTAEKKTHFTLLWSDVYRQ